MPKTTRRRMMTSFGGGLAASAAGLSGFAGRGRAAPAAVQAAAPAAAHAGEASAREHRDSHWVSTWATTPDAMECSALAGQTLRMITHISIGGSRLQVRLFNAYGRRRLVVGSAHIGIRSRGADMRPGSCRRLTFSGPPTFAILPEALAVGDAVDLDAALDDLAVGVYLPDDVSENTCLTEHDNAHQTNYISLRGDFSFATAFSVQSAIEAFAVVTSVDVLVPRTVDGVVPFGDSLTEGNLSEVDANDRWRDQLARRLAMRRDGRPLGVVNQGIGGNRLLNDQRGESALRRFDRDVLSQPGVTHAIVLIGINDLRNSGGMAEQIIVAEEVIEGLHQIALRGHASGIEVLCGTLLPCEGDTFNGGFHTPEGEGKCQAINAWIREGDTFDVVVDFEAMLLDPNRPTRLLPRWDSSDHLHPNGAGHRRRSDGIDFALFD